MGIITKTRQKAKELYKTIVLPEGEDSRVLDAAAVIAKEGLANLHIIGTQTVHEEMANRSITGGYSLITHLEDPRLPEFAEIYYEKRKAKGITPEEARKDMEDAVFFGNMLVQQGYADGCVAGAVHTTSRVLQAGLRIIGVKNGIKTVSSSFIVVAKNSGLGTNVFMFGDCAVNPLPTPEMLADIAVSTAETFETLIHQVPKVALLSMSTKGSAVTDDTLRVKKAAEILKEKAPTLLSDGELQLDAALVPEVGARKAPASPVAGHANVLIFPNLDAANIGYKLVERFSGADALGPIIQGFAKPVNDLSRGAKSEDIVNMVCITAVQAALESK